METVQIREFYKEVCGRQCPELNSLMDRSGGDIGHFNVFDIAQIFGCGSSKQQMPYNRRNYYKISLIKGRNQVEYADKVVEISSQGLLFASPEVPYRYNSLDDQQSGHFCVFTRDFLSKSIAGNTPGDFPIFGRQGEFVYELSDEQFLEALAVFEKIHREVASDYAYKYDLLRNYVLELIHFGQKLKPLAAESGPVNAASRIFGLFIELLERQFPIENPSQVLQLRQAGEFAERLRIHVNHLNKVLKDSSGKTTTQIISGRICEEAKILLRHTSWSISEIAYCLGFEEVAHFSNFFKRHTGSSPLAFREQLFD